MGTANHALVHGAGVEPARCSCKIYRTSNNKNPQEILLSYCRIS